MTAPFPALYHPEIPPLLREAARTPPLARLREVGMNCGCEYTSLPRFRRCGPYSRFDHSLGAALIAWHFTGDPAQAAAALLHDAATPAFAHAVDFLNGDHLRQESTESGTRERIAGSAALTEVLARYGLSPRQVWDDRRFPIVNCPAPRLCADRLEYTLGNLLHYGFAAPGALRAFYADLTVADNEDGAPELCFRTPEIASAFTLAALRCARVYVCDEDRFAMQALADLLALALERGVLTRADLEETEPRVIRLLEADPLCRLRWQQFRALSHVERRLQRPADGLWMQVEAKLRWIDPLVPGLGRVSRWDGAAAAALAEFRATSFSHWIGVPPA